MPLLVLSPRYTSDSKVLRAASGRLGWKTERLGGWRAPERLRGQDVALYGEPTFVEVIAAQLGVRLLDVAPGWLPVPACLALAVPARTPARIRRLTAGQFWGAGSEAR